MNIVTGDVLEMKKTHPCGSKRFLVMRTGTDIKIRCTVCGRELMLPRIKVEKSVKLIIKPEQEKI